MVVQKIWLTLMVLLPISVGIIMIDEGDSVISAIAVTEILSFVAMTIGVVIAAIWSA
jgi:hypothetical protein